VFGCCVVVCGLWEEEAALRGCWTEAGNAKEAEAKTVSEGEQDCGKRGEKGPANETRTNVKLRRSA